MSQLPSSVLNELLVEHDALRDLISRCEQLAEQLDEGRIEPDRLLEEVARLRVAFDAHNRYEEQYLRPMLLEADSFGSVRIDRMVDDHVAEHRLVGSDLGNAITGELRLALDRLRHHLASEERYFVSPKVLRDDLVVVEGSA